MTATFHVPPEKIAEIRAAADRGEKVEPVLAAEIVADDGELVARVTERLWVKKKERPKLEVAAGRPVPEGGRASPGS